MGQFATGVSKILSFKRETAWGQDPSPATGGRQLRRAQSTLNEERAQVASNELLPSQQVRDARHGFRQATGSINTEISPGNASDLFAALLRRDLTAGVTTGAQTSIAASASAPHLTRASGSFLADGFKLGDVVVQSGWTATAAGNNNRCQVVTALTATQMTLLDISGANAGVSATITAKAAGDGVTVAVAGKKTWVPQSGHTDVSYTFEHWHADIGQSERFNGCKLGQVQVSVQPGAMASAGFSVLGRGVQTQQTQFFASPGAPGAAGLASGSNGLLLVNNAPVGILTSFSFTVAANTEASPVIGTPYGADVLRGKLAVQGSFQAYFKDVTLRDAFLAEGTLPLGVILASSTAANADFINVQFPLAKLFSASKDDGEKKIIQSFNFLALENAANGGAGAGTEATTLSYQDSQG